MRNPHLIHHRPPSMHGHLTWPKRTHGAAFRPSSQPAASAKGLQRRLHQRQPRHAGLSLHTHSRCPPCPAGSGQLSIIGSSESSMLKLAMPSRRPRARVVAAAATETGTAASSTLPSNGKQQPTARQVNYWFLRAQLDHGPHARSRNRSGHQNAQSCTHSRHAYSP